MKPEELKELVRNIVIKAAALKDKYTEAKNIPVNYACVFSQSEAEYQDLLKTVKEIGCIKTAEATKMGPVFEIKPLETAFGPLRLLKIRRPDARRPERGDADFTVEDYPAFKEKYLGKRGFSLVKREDFEMIELQNDAFDVLAYFSNPPTDIKLGI